MKIKPFINKVTVTGADDSTSIEEMVTIQKEYPFVEFGILLRKFIENSLSHNEYAINWKRLSDDGHTSIYAQDLFKTEIDNYGK